ncbi:MAG: hypothetical protein OI74_02385 [Gammaproteobacteria bacterium (ex Lamellibrachia satsuma)]|nr:MAG: hypothetical protein OI74_02385 [Gammaproteobacteria bacterium (ex Lamellibrachia satsuma)]
MQAPIFSAKIIRKKRHATAILIFLLSISSAVIVDQKSDEIAYYQSLVDSPTIVSIQDGDWGNPATWDLARVPSYGDRVLVAHSTNWAALKASSILAPCICGANE